MTNTTREVVKLYDELIRQASFKLGKKIKCEWGDWVPSEVGINRLINRRNKLVKGA